MSNRLIRPWNDGQIVKPQLAGNALQLSNVARSMGCIGAILFQDEVTAPSIIGLSNARLTPASGSNSPAIVTSEEAVTMKFVAASQQKAILAPAPLILPTDAANLSIVARLKCGSTPAGNAYAVYIGDSNNNRAVGVGVTSAGNFGATVSTSNGEHFAASPNTPSGFTTIGVTSFGNVPHCFENGVDVASSTINGNTNIGANTSAYIQLGQRPGPYGPAYFDGQIAWVFLFTKGLSAAEHWFVAKKPWALLSPANLNFPLSSLISGGGGISLVARAFGRSGGMAVTAAAASIAGTSKGSVQGKPNASSAASLSAVSAGRVQARPLVSRTAALTARLRSNVSAAASMTATAALTATATSMSAARGAGLAVAYVAARARQSISGAASMAAAGALTAIAAGRVAARSLLSGPGALSAISAARGGGRGAPVAAAVLTARSHGMVSGKSASTASAILTGRASVGAKGAATAFASANLAARAGGRAASRATVAMTAALTGRAFAFAAGRAGAASTVGLQAISRVMAWASGLITVSGTVVPPLDDAGFVAATPAETYIPVTTRTSYVSAMNRWRP